MKVRIFSCDISKDIQRDTIMKQIIKMKHLKIISLILLLILTAIFLTQYNNGNFEKLKSENSGIPDLVNSISSNSDYTLTVIANSDTIENKEDFARTVITMCCENSFKTLQFSTDLGGYPTSLDISVYLHQEDIRASEPVCNIQYMPIGTSKEFDIKNHPEKFRLYLDGKEIEYF